MRGDEERFRKASIGRDFGPVTLRNPRLDSRRGRFYNPLSLPESGGSLRFAERRRLGLGAVRTGV
ncbi:MAG TPA: hypothetical protein DCQ98_12875 [Planctomycetaceae bacterium]|nr:hypothetical protein [Planctomycetaceae bacterium]